MSTEPYVLLLGRFTTPEMQPIAEWLAGRVDAANLQYADDVTAAAAVAGEGGWCPDLVVVVQSWPDEFGGQEVGRLIGLFPLARIVCCFGAWCESDGRNHNVWPLSVRVAARAAFGRLEHELAVIAGRGPHLPLTAGRDEIFEYDHVGEIRSLEPGLPMRVVSPDSEYRRALDEMLRAAGARIVRADEFPSAVAVLWDVDPWSERIAGELREFCRRHRHVAVVSLSGFAHPEDAAEMRGCGAAEVIPKLAPTAELLKAVSIAVAGRGQLSA